MIITIKVGSNVLTKRDGSLDKARMADIVRQIVKLRQMGHQVVLVSSGAMAAGRALVPTPKQNDTVSQRQLWSAMGQAELINVYSELFSIYDVKCAQLLVTKDDFRDRKHYLNLTNCLEAILEESVVPIVNENDAISVTALMFTDNDELSSMMASMSDAKALIILTNVDGIFTGHPDDENSELIRRVTVDDSSIEDSISTTKSGFGRGGMVTKYNTARKMASQGVEVVIANGFREGVLLEVLAGSDHCTRFVPEKKHSPVKKWIAQSAGFAKGVVVVDKKAVEVLQGPRVASLLPVGVLQVKGDFEKSDIIRIEDEQGCRIGIGCVSMSSNKLEKIIGVKGEHYVVHYNYLFVDAFEVEE